MVTAPDAALVLVLMSIAVAPVILPLLTMVIGPFGPVSLVIRMPTDPAVIVPLFETLPEKVAVLRITMPSPLAEIMPLLATPPEKVEML